MARLARIVAPGLPHHVTQRGNRNLDVFVADSNRLAYMSLLQKYAERHCVEVWAYCLMTNHIHLVAVPHKVDSLARTLRDTHAAYAALFNKQQGLTGHLWQGRYYSCVMDESHLWAAVRYIERNPLRAGIVRRPEDYTWSSAAAHCGRRADPLLSRAFPPPAVVDNWSAWLANEDIALTKSLRDHTRIGRPCGSEEFISGLEVTLGCRLRPGKRGRKPLIRGQTTN